MSKFIEDLRAKSLDELVKENIAHRWHEYGTGTLMLFLPEFYDQIPDGEELINPKNEYFTFTRDKHIKRSYWGVMPYGFVHPKQYEDQRVIKKSKGINLNLDCMVVA